jgi:asparagine synthase (glutamine-hydrolysing)
VRPQLDHEGLLYYLRYSYIPDPLTIFRGVAKLSPGHRLSLTGQALSVSQYWDGVAPCASTETFVSEDDTICRLEHLLQESVELRLVSDVPIGAFLSGGIDSSVVVALMARKMTRPVTTFSIGFQEDSYNELPYARQVAKHLGTNHHEFIVGPQGCDLIERIVSHFDEPFGDPSAMPTYYLSRLAAEHVTVALSGDGGDELFAGYDRYRVELERSKFDVVPLAARRMLGFASDLFPEGFYGKRFLRNISLPSRQRYLDSISYLGPGRFGKLLAPDLLTASDRLGSATRIMEEHLNEAAGCPWLAQIQYLDAKTYLPGDVMTKVDRMSMAHSLEAREPLLDHVLAEYVSGLPPQLKFRNGVSKYLLKRVAEKLLPMEIVHRRKQGFGVPLEYWFQGGLREYVHDVLFDSRASGRGLFRSGEVANMVRLYDRGRKDLATTIWMLVVLETWFRLYLDKESRLDKKLPACVA